MIIKQISLITVAAAFAVSASAQVKNFKVAALNVDGLPANVATISINPDSKGSAGAQAISQKLATKSYDIVGLSEDFNYHGSIMSAIGDIYNQGTHRGSIDAGTTFLALLRGLTFDTDGLELLWKKGLDISCESWTQWNKWNGKTDQGADGLIKKGFRYYLLNLGDDFYADIYILHMDAEINDGDIAARESQMQQLADDILRINPSCRPKIVMGDTNCRYTRDHLKTLFIDVINADPRYTIKDAWVEKCKNNTYPTYGANALMVDQLGYVDGEIVDKIFYIQPKYGAKLVNNGFYVDTDFNDTDGSPLADHYPVVASFAMRGKVYDPATYWSGSYDTDEYRAYARAYNNLLPLTVPTLRSPHKEQLAALLTEHVTTGSDIVTRINAFMSDFYEYMTTNYTREDYTSKKLKNPSFEEGDLYSKGVVSDWVVGPTDGETFIASNFDDNEQHSIYYMEGGDGDRMFNTWGGTATNGYFCHQSINLTQGWYHLSAIVATDGSNQVGLRFGDSCILSQPFTNKEQGQLLEGFFYHTGGAVTIGAECDTWFKADDFHLNRLISIPSAINDLTTESSNSSVVPSPTFIYAPDGRQLTTLKRGLNIVRRADGTTQKLLVR